MLAALDIIINAFWSLDSTGQVTGRVFAQEPILALGTCYASLGGWGNCATFSSVFQSPLLRTQAIKNIGTAINAAGWKGLDLDWESPASDADYAALVAFLTEYRLAWPLHGLSVALSSEVDKAMQVAGLADWFHIMTYDYCGDWSSVSGTSSGLSQGLVSLQDYVKAGFPASKLLLGSAWYGKQCTITSGSLQIPGSPATAWSDVPYSDIHDSIEKAGSGWTVTTLPGSDSAWAVNLATSQAVSYESAAVVAAKHVSSQAYGGIFCWDWTQDSSDGSLAACF
jgi:chitinase